MMRRTQTRRRHLCALVGRHSGRSCAPPSISSPSPRGGSMSTQAGSARCAEREGLRGQLSLRWHGGDGGSNRYDLFTAVKSRLPPQPNRSIGGGLGSRENSSDLGL
jgi:hypothetical protein